MPDAKEIYEAHPGEYDALVRCEDRDGNLLPAIREIAGDAGPLARCDVVELGAGTGRLTTLLAPHVRSIRAFDLAAPMVALARAHLERLALDNWSLGVADNAALPVPDHDADLAIAGWTYGHQTVWNEHAWRAPIERAIGEMLRVLRPGGTAIVLETLGTGHTKPFTPPPALARYYTLLEERGFRMRWVRTDYRFASVADGERLVRLFFGDDRAQAFVASGSTVLPECTGLWSRRA